MKSAEFGIVNEGVWSGIKSATARSGILGKEKQINAINDRGADLAYKTGLASFTKELSNAITRSYSAGAIGPSQAPTPTPTTTADTTTSPPANTAPQKIDPAKAAELKGRLKAKAGTTSAPSNFKNYVAGSGERMTSVDKSGAPVFKKIQRESEFDEYNRIFESALMEAQGISDFVSDFVAGQASEDQFMIPQQFAPTLKTLSDQLEATFLKSGGKTIDQNIVRKLWDLYYTAAKYAGKPQAKQSEPQKHTQASPTQVAPATNSPQADSQRQEWQKMLVKRLSELDLNDPNSLKVIQSITSQLVKYLKQAGQTTGI